MSTRLFIILVALSFGSPGWAAELETTELSHVKTAVPRNFHLASGLGFDSHLVQDVNPDYNQARFSGQVFAGASYGAYGVNLELEQLSHASSSGSLNVTSRSNYVALWPRYQWQRSWSPFVALGVGAYFDHVDTTFQNATASNEGLRYLAGIGGGVSKTFWKYWLVEAEARVGAVQQNTNADFSTVLRTGFLY